MNIDSIKKYETLVIGGFRVKIGRKKRGLAPLLWICYNRLDLSRFSIFKRPSGRANGFFGYKLKIYRRCFFYWQKLIASP